MLEYLELVALFFIQGAALGMWFVPLSNVLDAYGLNHIRPYAFAASGIAAFIFPLIFGAMADRHASPVKVLRGLSFATAIGLMLTSSTIQFGLSPWLVLLSIQLHSLCSSPTWSISSAIVFSRVADARKEFGPIRAMATLGWMAGCVVVSMVGADASVLAFVGGAIAWLAVFGLTFFMPPTMPKVAQKLSWHERLGLDALKLLKIRDHRVVFITTLLFAIPLTAFYPYAPPHLRELGFQNISAWMSLGQVLEVFVMFALGGLLLRWRLKWILSLGLVLGVLRYVFSAMNTPNWLLLGVLLHGASFTLIFITAQIYLDQRVDPQWRTRAQALLSVLNSGVGNLVGYLGTGWWFAVCTQTTGTRWTLFWSVLAGAVAAILVYFLAAYRGRGAKSDVPSQSG